MATLTVKHIRILDVSGNPVTSGSFDLRQSPFLSTGVSGTHITQGYWRFVDVADGGYKLYNTATASEVTSYTSGGARVEQVWDGDISAAKIVEGVLDVARLPTAIPAINIGSGSISNAEFDHLNGISSNIQTQLDGKAGLANNNVFTGENIFQDTTDFEGQCVWTGIYRPQIGSTANTNSNNSGAIMKRSEILDEIASATAGLTAFQESYVRRRVWRGAATEANKVYGTIAAAIDSCTSPSATKQFYIEIQGTSTNTSLTQYIDLLHSKVTNYIHIGGVGHHIHLLLGGAFESASLSRTMTFRNLSIILGGNDITTARTYDGITFENCIIYAWKNTTYQNCILRGCTEYRLNTTTPTIAGTSKVLRSEFNMEVTISGSNTQQIGMIDGFDNTYTIFTDPTSGGGGS